jgi:hypothetical protein
MSTPEKWQKLFSENKVPRFRDIKRPEMPRNAPKCPDCTPRKMEKVVFCKQGTPFLGQASKTGPKWAQNGQNGHAWSHFRKIGFTFHQTINGAVFFAPKKFRKLPSAASSLHKSISSISFLDIFFVHFLKIFSSLEHCKIRLFS